MALEWKERIQNLVVKFACRTSVTRGGPSISKALAAGLQEVWPDHFESDLQILPPGGLYAMQRRYYMASGMVDASSFVLRQDGCEINLVRKLNGQVPEEAGQDLWAEDQSVLQRVKRCFLKVQEVIPNFRVFRTTQMYELVLAPVSFEELSQVQRSIFGSPDPELGEVQLLRTRYHEHAGRLYNYRTEVGYVADVVGPSRQYGITVGVDTNNRRMEKSLDPHDWEAIWRHGQENRPRVLDELFADRVDG